MASLHQPSSVKFPHFISIRTQPLSRWIVRLIRKAHRNFSFVKSPKLFDETVLEFPRPFSGQESDDLIPAVNKLGSIAPPAVDSVALRNFFGIASVPVVL